MKPEMFLTREELNRLAEIQKEGREKVTQHRALAKKMRSSGLTDDEKVELRTLATDITSLEKEHKSLLGKNPMLAANVVKAFEEQTRRN